MRLFALSAVVAVASATVADKLESFAGHVAMSSPSDNGSCTIAWDFSRPCESTCEDCNGCTLGNCIIGRKTCTDQTSPGLWQCYCYDDYAKETTFSFYDKCEATKQGSCGGACPQDECYWAYPTDDPAKWASRFAECRCW